MTLRTPLLLSATAACLVFGPGCARSSKKAAAEPKEQPSAAAVDPALRTETDYDAVWLDDQHTRDLLLVTDATYGPEHSVVIAAKVPESYYADGAIHMTNGRQLRIVSPRAWSTYSGTAMSAQEAAEVIARAQAINRSSTEYRQAVAQLREVIENYSASSGVARAEAYNRAEQLRAQAYLVETQEDLEKLAAQRKQVSSELDAALTELEKIRTTIQERSAALEDSISAVTDGKRTDSLRGRLDSEAKALSELEQDVEQHRGKLGSLSASLDGSTSSTTVMKESLSTEEAAIVDVTKRADQLAKDIKIEQTRLDEMTKENGDADALRQELAELEKQIAAKKEALKNIEKGDGE